MGAYLGRAARWFVRSCARVGRSCCHQVMEPWRRVGRPRRKMVQETVLKSRRAPNQGSTNRHKWVKRPCPCRRGLTMEDLDTTLPSFRMISNGQEGSCVTSSRSSTGPRRERMRGPTRFVGRLAGPVYAAAGFPTQFCSHAQGSMQQAGPIPENRRLVLAWATGLRSLLPGVLRDRESADMVDSKKERFAC